MNNIKTILDERFERYNLKEFIKEDPIQIPHLFTQKEDIEISAFLTATIAWGQRKSIIKNAVRLMELMENSPYKFIMESIPDYNKINIDKPLISLSKDKRWRQFEGFCHRTFNSEDTLYFLLTLKRIYSELDGLEDVFTSGYQKDETIYSAIKHFRETFLYLPHNKRVEKHISNVEKKSAAKRINMFLRWMVREDEVDFGLWKNIPTSKLMLPLDLHSGNISREIGILKRSQNDWLAVEEVTKILRKFDADDPIKYDFALFGSGVYSDSPITPTK